MIKLAFSTLGCPEWDFDRIVSQAHSYGFEGVEVRGIQNMMSPESLVPFDREHCAESRRLLEKNSVRIICLNTSIRFQKRGEAERYALEAKESFALCRRMGIPAIRVFGDTYDGQDPALVTRWIIEGIGALCDMAGDIGILLEIHGDIKTKEAIAPIVEALKDRDNFGLIWDVGHSDHIYRENWMEFYEYIRPYIHHVHLKDQIRALGKEGYVPVGEGEVPLVPIIRRLMADGYNGYLSFEWEKRWHSELSEPEVVFPEYVKYCMDVLNG